MKRIEFISGCCNGSLQGKDITEYCKEEIAVGVQLEEVLMSLFCKIGGDADAGWLAGGSKPIGSRATLAQQAIDERLYKAISLIETYFGVSLFPVEFPVEDEKSRSVLPSELNTELSRKYFTKAIKAGFMKKEGNGYKWLFGDDKGQIRLGYFCSKVFAAPRPINKLEEIFGVKKLSASITNAGYAAKRADVKKWKDEMNNAIFND